MSISVYASTSQSRRVGAIAIMAAMVLASCTGRPLVAANPGMDGAPPTDAIHDAADSMMPTDALADGAPDVSASGLFESCTSATQCEAPATRCDQGYAGGLCTRRCAADSDCGDGRCFNHGCIPSCTLGGGQCDATEVCDFFDAIMPDVRGCFPSCSNAPPPGASQCNVGLSCDPYNGGGFCTSLPPRTGGDDGDPCRTDGDCKGLCVPEVDMNGAPTGYSNGMCLSFGRVPADSTFAIGTPAPHANCPYGTVIVPAETMSSDGDVGYCERQCSSDADCRLGYGCIFFVDGMGGQTATGFCDAINCLAPEFATIPNHRCPDGFTCQSIPTDGGTPEGLCARVVTDGGTVDDSGADGGTDVVDD